MVIGLLLLSSGLLWTATYALIIRQGFRDQIHGMPLVALCANLAWEFIFAFVMPHSTAQRYVNMVWLGFDLVILYQLLRFGPREFPELGRRLFYGLVGLCFATSFGVIVLVSREFNDAEGAYAAVGQNLLMSALFVGMLYRRRSTRGQSVAIAVCKLLGTVCASLAFARIMPMSGLLTFLYIAIFAFDTLYLGLVIGMRHAPAPAPARQPSSLFIPRVQPPTTPASGLPWYREN